MPDAKLNQNFSLMLKMHANVKSARCEQALSESVDALGVCVVLAKLGSFVGRTQGPRKGLVIPSAEGQRDRSPEPVCQQRDIPGVTAPSRTLLAISCRVACPRDAS